MKAGVLMTRLAVATIAGSAGLAQAGVEPPSAHAGRATASSATSNSATANPKTGAATFLSSLVGEWEGSIQTRNPEGMTSSSVASASCRLENAGKRLACSYEGFAFGQPTDGALVLSAGASGGSTPTSALCRDGATAKATGAFEHGAMTFTFERSERNKLARFEQVVKAADPNHFTVELSRVESSGKKTLAFKLEMTRLESGEQSGAAAGFEKSKPLASARSAAVSGGGTQTAGVESNH